VAAPLSPSVQRVASVRHRCLGPTTRPIHHPAGPLGQHQIVQNTVSFNRTLLIASIPAAIALLGVIVTVAWGQWRAGRTWKEEREERQTERDHQAQLDRDRFLRAERITVYRRLHQAADDMLVASTLAVERHEREWRLIGRAEQSWGAALGEVQMVGARSVREAAESIEQVRTDRFRIWVLDEFIVQHQAAEETPTDETEAARSEALRSIEQRALVDRLLDVNDERLTALRTACREDIGSLKL
jgi:hypothetical protein